jgi:hypothetical protein
MSIEPIKYFDAIADNRAISNEEGSFRWIYGKVGWCPHCHIKTIEVFSQGFTKYCEDDPLYHDPCLDEYYHLTVWNCSCGWWDTLRSGNTGHDSIDPPYNFDPIWRHGIIKLFDVGDPDLPITILRRELLKRKDILYHISDKKMEGFVAAVFSDYYGKCHATICGKSGDGGIDIILIEGERPIAIQVKRRLYPGKVEPVNLIREFLAAMQLKDIDVGIYVSNADRFSRSAVQTADLAVDKGLVQSFTLINKSRFLSILNATKTSTKEPWERYVDELMHETKSFA